MTKMAAMSIYGKNPSKFFFDVPKRASIYSPRQIDIKWVEEDHSTLQTKNNTCLYDNSLALTLVLVYT